MFQRLDSISCKVLKYFIKTNKELNVSEVMHYISKFKKSKLDSYTLAKITIETLIDIGYIKLSRQNGNDKFYILSSFGRLYFRNAVIAFFVNFIYPIIVTTIGCYITYLLSN